MQKFTFVLRNEKYRLYDRFANFIFVLNALAILYFFITGLRGDKYSTGSIVIAVVAIFAIATWFAPFAKKKKSFFFMLAAITSVVYWIWTGQPWISLLLAFLFSLYLISKRPLRIVVEAGGISYPTFPSRKIAWNELNNVIAKDDLLTIDFRDNHLSQQMIRNAGSSFDEKEFNEFCRQHLLR